MFRRHYEMIVVLVICALFVNGCGSNGQVFEKQIPAKSLRGNLIGEPIERSIAVYLPPSYASTSNRYPAIYLLTDFMSGVNVFLDGTFREFRLLESMDRLIKEEKIGEMIVVVVDGRNLLGGSFYVNSPVTGNWEDVVVKDVVRYVDENYKTLPHGESRGIAGFGMGGFGALNIAMRHPDVFCAVYALSPSLFELNGLREHLMFLNKETVHRFVTKQEELRRMDRDDAHAAFLAHVKQLIASGVPADNILAYSYAYGAAFSPDLETNAPYIWYPYSLQGKTGSLNGTVWKDWHNGLGGFGSDIVTYRENLLKLEAIALDAGKFDRDRWIVNGCKYYSKRLDDEGIPHELTIYDGDHDNQVPGRIKQHLLPMFSRVLKTQ